MVELGGFVFRPRVDFDEFKDAGEGWLVFYEFSALFFGADKEDAKRVFLIGGVDFFGGAFEPVSELGRGSQAVDVVED